MSSKLCFRLCKKYFFLYFRSFLILVFIQIFLLFRNFLISLMLCNTVWRSSFSMFIYNRQALSGFLFLALNNLAFTGESRHSPSHSRCDILVQFWRNSTTFKISQLSSMLSFKISAKVPKSLVFPSIEKFREKSWILFSHSTKILQFFLNPYFLFILLTIFDSTFKNKALILIGLMQISVYLISAWVRKEMREKVSCWCNW